ncbi:MAG TPA: hypothetical protein DIC42_03085 [Holosporales bacterium]|nr:hypothetical protein [Holosporales bacterium]
MSVISYINHHINTKHTTLKTLKMILVFTGICSIVSAETCIFDLRPEAEYNLTFNTVRNAFENAFPPAQGEEHYVNEKTVPLLSDFMLHEQRVSTLDPATEIGTLTRDIFINVTLIAGTQEGEKILTVLPCSNISFEIAENYWNTATNNLECSLSIENGMDYIGNSPEMLREAIRFTQTQRLNGVRWSFQQQINGNSFTLRAVSLG